MLPARNRKDFEDIPEEVRQQLTFVWLERVDEAVSSAFEPIPPAKVLPVEPITSDAAPATTK
jgi:ATP-dependent Lon protease